MIPKRRPSLLLLPTILTFFCATQCHSALAEVSNSLERIDADSSEAQTWRDKTNTNVLPAKVGNQLVHRMEMNNTPAKEVITEICRRGGVRAILDKSVDDKKVTGNFSDVTLNEVLSSILSSLGLRSKPLTDNLMLIETVEAERAIYQQTDEPQLPDNSNSAVRHPTKSTGFRYGEIPPPPPMRQLVSPPPAFAPGRL